MFYSEHGKPIHGLDMHAVNNAVVKVHSFVPVIIVWLKGCLWCLFEIAAECAIMPIMCGL